MKLYEQGRNRVFRKNPVSGPEIIKAQAGIAASSFSIQEAMS
jgi:hypothetical protein